MQYCAMGAEPVVIAMVEWEEGQSHIVDASLSRHRLLPCAPTMKVPLPPDKRFNSAVVPVSKLLQQTTRTVSQMILGAFL